MNLDDYLRISALSAAHRWGDVIEEVDRVLATTPDEGAAWATRALALVNLGRFTEALEAADRAAGLNPGDEWLQRLRAIALRGLRRPRSALAAAEAAIALAPTNDDTKLELARCQLAARRQRTAERTATEVVGTHPGSVEAWIVLGETRLGRDNVAAADAFKKALAIDPSSAAATNGLGMAHQRVGMRREAAGLYTQAARMSPTAAAPRHNLAHRAPVGPRHHAPLLRRIDRFLRARWRCAELSRLSSRRGDRWVPAGRFGPAGTHRLACRCSPRSRQTGWSSDSCLRSSPIHSSSPRS